MQAINTPMLNGEKLYIPFVGAIERIRTTRKKQILIQMDEKSSDKKYSGKIVLESPDKIYTAFLEAIKKYLDI
jgi:hypothetical protein